MATKTIIATGRRELEDVALRHPLNDCPAVAERVGYYRLAGYNVGLVLRFADGHTASLTYAEIRDLQAVPETAVTSIP